MGWGAGVARALQAERQCVRGGGGVERRASPQPALPRPQPPAPAMRGGARVAARGPAPRPRPRPARATLSDAEFDLALSKARACVHTPPIGQMMGRAGERCTD